MVHSDKDLLEYYWLGWFNKIDGNCIKSPLLKRAYMMGMLDFEIGDEVGRIDCQTDEEILEIIKLKELKNESKIN